MEFPILISILGLLVIASAVKFYLLFRQSKQIALLISRADSETALNGVADGVIQINSSSKILAVNQAICELTRYSGTELVGQPLQKIMPERYRARHGEKFAEYVATGVKTLDWFSIPLHVLTAWGEEVAVYVSFAEFKVEGQMRFVGIIRRRKGV